jgi:hypothetical protein
MKMRTGMCWRKADVGYTRQYYIEAGPITLSDHLILQEVTAFADKIITMAKLWTKEMVKFNGGSEIQWPIVYKEPND